MSEKAAFIRVEGVLLDKPTLRSAAYLAMNAKGLGERFFRLGNVAMALPLKVLGELQVGEAASRMTWMGLRGMTLDRLELLSEEYYEDHLKEALFEDGKRLIQKLKKEGYQVVLLSDNIDLIVSHLLDELGADDLITNQLEIRHDKATGRLEDPILDGSNASKWTKQYAIEKNYNLSDCVAYGSAIVDSLLLSTTGKACAVNPDWQLRRLAKEQEWPVLEL